MNALDTLLCKHKDHLTISSNDLWAGNPKFQFSRHTVPYLAQIIITYSARRGDGLSALQKSAIKCYRSNKIFWQNVPGVSDSDILEGYFKLFDKLFFFGSLRGHCTIIFSGRDSRSTDENGRCIDHADNPFFPWIEKKLRVTIVLYSRHSEKDRLKRQNLCIGTLLHEMLHAFIKLWGCRGQGCRERHENEGVAGHGIAWQKAAYALELAVRDVEFLNLKVRLSRELSWGVELRVSGRRVDEEAKRLARSWGMSASEVEKWFKVTKFRPGHLPGDR